MAKPESTHSFSTSPDVSLDELQLGVRNHSLPLEALRYPITPIGLHYLLIHFDIPRVDPSGWRFVIGGHVRNPLTLTLDEIKRRPAVTRAVTLEARMRWERPGQPFASSGQPAMALRGGWERGVDGHPATAAPGSGRTSRRRR